MIIGLGHFGLTIAQNLVQNNFETLAIEKKESIVNEVENKLPHVVQADASNENVLQSLDIGHFDTGIITMRDNILASIMSTLLLKKFGVNEVIARAGSEMHGEVLEQVGADKVIFLERGMGERISQFFISGDTDILEYINFTSEDSLFTSDYSLIEITPPEFMIGKSLKELKLRTKYGITVIAIKGEDETIFGPDADQIIQEDEILLVIGKNKDLNQITG